MSKKDYVRLQIQDDDEEMATMSLIKFEEEEDRRERDRDRKKGSPLLGRNLTPENSPKRERKEKETVFDHEDENENENQGEGEGESTGKEEGEVEEVRVVVEKELKKLEKFDSLRLLSLAKPETLILILGSVALAVSSFSFLLLPNFAGKIIDAVSKGGTQAQLNKVIWQLILAFTLGALFAFVKETLFKIAAERVVARLRKQLFASIIHQEIGFFDVTRTGELINRLSSDSKVIENAVTINVTTALRYFAQSVGCTIILFVISWKLTLVMLSIVPVVTIGAVVYGRYIRRMNKQVQEVLAAATAVAQESISNIRTVRSFSNEPWEMKRYDESIDETYQLGKRMGFISGIFSGAVFFAGNFAIVVVLWYGGSLVIEGSISSGTLTSFILYTITVGTSLGGLSAIYGEMMGAVGASQRVFQLLDRKAEVRYSGGIELPSIQGTIQLEKVSFSYPSRPDTPVLKDVNLTLLPGQVVALVGPSGGGKSTITHLLEVFYYPEKGRILIDGKDLRELDPLCVRQQMAIVSQEPTLFASSIRQNIAYGLDHIPDEEIVRVSKMANAHEFISAFAEGYDTEVGERGVKLSGGQKQRVAIARALLKNPKILLLDEATSALDAQSEYLVQEALDRLMKGRTVLVIAHRLSTVKNANLVVVIDEGTVVEQGSHEALLEKNGIYKKLVTHQLQELPLLAQ